MNDNETLIVAQEEAGVRLDKFLALRFPDQSRTYFQMLIEQGLVLVNGAQAKKRTLMQSEDEIEVEFALTPELSLEPENIPLDILYEDEDLLGINKPAGLVVHPAAGNWSGTFVNALLYYCNLQKDNTLRPGIVHRLDKDTTGVLIAAKNTAMQQALVELFAQRKMHKQYLAICVGNPGKRRITGAIGRHPIHRKMMAIVQEGGKDAITDCETLLWDGQLSLVRLTPLTGRTHQLRVHLKSVGTPILGDALYGSASTNQKWNIFRQLLHAERLQFTHPKTGQLIEIVAKIPEDFHNFVIKLEKKKT